MTRTFGLAMLGVLTAAVPAAADAPAARQIAPRPVAASQMAAQPLAARPPADDPNAPLNPRWQVKSWTISGLTVWTFRPGHFVREPAAPPVSRPR